MPLQLLILSRLRKKAQNVLDVRQAVIAQAIPKKTLPALAEVVPAVAKIRILNNNSKVEHLTPPYFFDTKAYQ